MIVVLIILSGVLTLIGGAAVLFSLAVIVMNAPHPFDLLLSGLMLLFLGLQCFRFFLWLWDEYT